MWRLDDEDSLWDGDAYDLHCVQSPPVEDAEADLVVTQTGTVAHAGAAIAAGPQSFTADLTIMEEGSEFLERAGAAIKSGKAVLPMITSCSPGWINYMEHFNPDMLPHLSTCKSPQQMLGALAKTYYAEKLEVLGEANAEVDRALDLALLVGSAK